MIMPFLFHSLIHYLDSIRVEIEDNGKGIAQKDLQKIFERFYRTDASRNSAQGGSGIGLSIVKKIVEDHGGYVWATAKEGEGTCMHFVLRKYIELQPGGIHFVKNTDINMPVRLVHIFYAVTDNIIDDLLHLLRIRDDNCVRRYQIRIVQLDTPLLQIQSDFFHTVTEIIRHVIRWKLYGIRLLSIPE